MRVLIIGGRGQLGTELARHFGDDHELILAGSADIDIRRWEASAQIAELRPALVLLPAAYTDVDGCTRNPDMAYQVNTLGPKYVAQACARLDIPLVYISTNEVFDGAAATSYREYDQPAPINAYGRSKWGGEQAVMQHLRRFYIVRVAWLYGGPKNFVRSVLRLTTERPSLQMVHDEVGSPTYAADAARAIAQLVQSGCYGIYHCVNEGQCSRYELAREILRLSGREEYQLQPISLAQYQRASTPPPFSALRNAAAAELGITLRPWEQALAEYVGNL